MRYQALYVLFGVIFLFLSASSVAFAVDDDELVEIDFEVISMKGTIRDLFYVNSDGNKIPLLAYEGSRSFEYTYKGGPILRLFSGDNVENATPVAEVNLAGAGPENLLLISPKSDGAYSALLLRDGAASHPLGSYRFFNFTDASVAVVANDSQHLLAPMSDNIVEVFPEDSSGTTCRIRVAIREEDTWRKLYANTWIGSSKSRYLAIIQRNESGKTTIRRIKDTL
ncbi:hypothetical protein [Rubellicoccus peritrichatus]|uniref:Alginate biosynthesis protein AlgF n=1 Tax=Rubellicoccus peritrichatus TaxID=3080537 RepID=A0AAQ3QX04_9BACT|nr:hypothetical protein [Puniceicoccus sp. CR14]WOO43188.1 hypothetical protein RZN69_08785 [Puniceicoccus sp. CR14]